MLEDYEIEKYIIPRSLEIEILSNLEQINFNSENIYPGNKGLYLSFSLNSYISYFYQEFVFANKRSWDESIENYKKSIDINPNCSSTYNNLGICWKENKDYNRLN